MRPSWFRPATRRHWPPRCWGWPVTAPSWPGCAGWPASWPGGDSHPSRSWARWRSGCRRPPAPALPRSPRVRYSRYGKESCMTSASVATGPPGGINAVAPLAPNAWLRYDLVERMLPAGVTDVLEIGCGRGSLGARLAQRYHYLGLEPDRASWELAQQRIRAVGRGEVRNITSDQLGTERFDLVCAFEVLEHMEDDAAALKQW